MAGLACDEPEWGKQKHDWSLWKSATARGDFCNAKKGGQARLENGASTILPVADLPTA
jgi:hypothetical protein